MHTLIFSVIEYIPQDILDKIKDKLIAHNIFGIQDNESIKGEFYCIAFIEYMLAGKTLIVYSNLFFPNDFKKMKIWYISILKINMGKKHVLSLD